MKSAKNSLEDMVQSIFEVWIEEQAKERLESFRATGKDPIYDIDYAVGDDGIVRHKSSE